MVAKFLMYLRPIKKKKRKEKIHYENTIDYVENTDSPNNFHVDDTTVDVQMY